MQLEKDARKNLSTQSSRFDKRIGSTTYRVNVISGTEGCGTVRDKVMRLLTFDLSTENPATAPGI